MTREPPEQRHDLVGQLVGSDVQVGVVLDELTHARQSRQRAGPFVAMQPPELAEAQMAVRRGLDL